MLDHTIHVHVPPLLWFRAEYGLSDEEFQSIQDISATSVSGDSVGGGGGVTGEEEDEPMEVEEGGAGLGGEEERGVTRGVPAGPKGRGHVKRDGRRQSRLSPKGLNK